MGRSSFMVLPIVGSTKALIPYRPAPGMGGSYGADFWWDTWPHAVGIPYPCMRHMRSRITDITQRLFVRLFVRSQPLRQIQYHHSFRSEG